MGPIDIEEKMASHNSYKTGNSWASREMYFTHSKKLQSFSSSPPLSHQINDLELVDEHESLLHE